MPISPTTSVFPVRYAIAIPPVCLTGKRSLTDGYRRHRVQLSQRSHAPRSKDASVLQQLRITQPPLHLRRAAAHTYTRKSRPRSCLSDGALIQPTIYMIQHLPLDFGGVRCRAQTRGAMASQCPVTYLGGSEPGRLHPQPGAVWRAVAWVRGLWAADPARAIV